MMGGEPGLEDTLPCVPSDGVVKAPRIWKTTSQREGFDSGASLGATKRILLVLRLVEGKGPRPRGWLRP